MILWSIGCVAAGYIGAKYWDDDIKRVVGNIKDKITNKK